MFLCSSCHAVEMDRRGYCKTCRAAYDAGRVKTEPKKRGPRVRLRACVCGLARSPETGDCAARCRAIRAELIEAEAAQRRVRAAEVRERQLPSVEELRKGIARVRVAKTGFRFGSAVRGRTR